MHQEDKMSNSSTEPGQSLPTPVSPPQKKKKQKKTTRKTTGKPR